MRKSLLILVAVFSAGAASAFADPITLTFSGLKDLEPITNYYNGGAGGHGSTGGTNYGIAFTPDSLAIISELNGGSGNFSNVPSPATDTVAFFLSGAGDTMNVAGGFTDGFAFFYSAPFFNGSVQVFSGLNGTGNLLATDSLALTGDKCDPRTDYSCWVNSGVSFAGTAESAVFTGTANYVGFADITLGASSVPTGPSNPTAVTPEPSTFVLFGSGLLGLGGVIRRKAVA